MATCLGYVEGGTGAAYPFELLFDSAEEVDISEIKRGKYTAIVLWGGEDISPSIYNERLGKYTGASLKPSRRDYIECTVVKAAIENHVPLIGVCRGAQLLCAMAGGKLIQHIEGHASRGEHELETEEGLSIVSNSLHHQMMYPFDIPHELIAWIKHKETRKYLDENNDPILEMKTLPEPEIVYFPEIHGLGIQGHPEFCREDTDFVDYCRTKVKEYLLDTQK